MTRSPSITVGTRPFGLSFRYSGSRLPPKGPPWSTRSNGRSSSAQHHSTFCTLDELARPQIFSMAAFPRDRMLVMEPENAGECNADAPARYNGTRSLTAVEVRMKRFAIALALAVLAPAAAPASQQGQIV